MENLRILVKWGLNFWVGRNESFGEELEKMRLCKGFLAGEARGRAPASGLRERWPSLAGARAPRSRGRMPVSGLLTPSGVLQREFGAPQWAFSLLEPQDES
ncbi:hypothetical protein TIFTF001_053210 [Ficus carica]|uniref:Uncharacterized protein n=1 Tax=Ficus carica TaxID=3494 RepID=A0AA88EHF7_FICCA|nr:hypothetical protein TIFTF001_053210 [Ficus carica]